HDNDFSAHHQESSARKLCPLPRNLPTHGRFPCTPAYCTVCLYTHHRRHRFRLKYRPLQPVLMSLQNTKTKQANLSKYIHTLGTCRQQLSSLAKLITSLSLHLYSRPCTSLASLARYLTLLPPDTGSPSSQRTILGAGRAVGYVAGYAELNQAMKDDLWSLFSSEDDFNL